MGEASAGVERAEKARRPDALRRVGMSRGSKALARAAALALLEARKAAAAASNTG